jgi:protein phosphatase
VADVFDPSMRGPGGAPNAETQFIEMPVTVGAVAEHPGGSGLPSFGAVPAQAAGGPGANAPRNTDEIPADTPAGRAARLRRHDRREKAADELEGPQVGDWAPDPKRRRWVKPAIALGAIVVVVGGLGGGAYYWTQQQYYVASDNGKVAIYKGVNASLAGIRLSHIYSTTPQVAVSTLPMASQERVRDTITATSLSDAESIVSTLSVLGQDCTALTTAPSMPMNPPTAASVSASASGAVPSSPAAAAGRPSLGAAGKPSAGPLKSVANSPSPPLMPSPSPSASIAESNQLSAQCPGANGNPTGNGSS